MQRTLLPELPLSKINAKELKTEYIKLLNAEETIDRAMISESISNYLLPEVDYRDKVCLDLGANIGSFTKIALDGGAKKVCLVECDRRNFEKLQNSFQDEDSVDLKYAAVSGLEDTILKIFKSSSKTAHCTTTIYNKTRFNGYDTVDNIHIKTLLEEYMPDIIKVDIEGAEYTIIEYLIDYFPDVLFLELHGDAYKKQMETYTELLTEKYNISKIEHRISFQRNVANDCLFKK